MNPSELRLRFDELDAGRAMDDLSAEELIEWQRLKDEHGFEPDAGFDLLVGGLESNLPAQNDSFRPELAQQLEAAVPSPSNETEDSIAEVIPFWRHPALGWAAAAALAMGLWINQPAPVPAESSLASQRTDLLAAGDSLQLDFSGTPDFAALSGDVIWADKSQTGFMRFSGLPANDPTKSQYQLWIVDPARDEVPVDGGVFDIPSGGGEVIVPVRAKLGVSHPVAFVITVEQPGGVVVSKQEIVAAIAQRG